MIGESNGWRRLARIGLLPRDDVLDVEREEVLPGFIGDAESIEFAVMGDAANYSSRYCTGAQTGEILISPNVHSHVWKQVNSEARTLTTKREGEIEAHVVKALRART